MRIENRLKVEKQLLSNMLTSLRKDSSEIARILPYQEVSLKQQNKLINTTVEEILDTYSDKEIGVILYELWLGGYGFYPKFGAYNSIISSKGIDIIKSESVKSKLIDLYDYEYKRYESIDKVLDNMFLSNLVPFINGKVGFYVTPKFDYSPVERDKFKSMYQELQLECKNLTAQSGPSVYLLRNIRQNVNLLNSEMEEELQK